MFLRKEKYFYQGSIKNCIFASIIKNIAINL